MFCGFEGAIGTKSFELSSVSVQFPSAPPGRRSRLASELLIPTVVSLWGALLTGVARWMKAHSPETRIIGISSVHAPAMHDSWKAGRIIESTEARTIADGIAVRIPIPEAVWDMNGIVDDVFLVEESSIHAAMKLLLEEERLIVEPAGAVGVAALVEHAGLREYSRGATVLCGSNMTQEQIKTWLLD